MFAEDLSAFMADFGVPCTAGSASFLGIFDQPASVIGLGHAEVVSAEYSLVAQATDVAAVKSGNTVMVNGTAFKVREKLPEGDGAFVRLTLSK